MSHWDWFVRTEELDDFDFSVLSFDRTVAAYSPGLGAWRFLLALRLLALMAQDEGLTQRNGILLELKRDLERLGLLASSNLTAMADRTLKRGGAVDLTFLAKINVKGDSESKLAPKAPGQIGEALLDVFGQLKAADGKYILCVDGLDYVLRDGKTNIGAIADLMNAARSINESLVRARVDGKVILLLREEIARLVPSPDLTKRLMDNGVSVDWNTNIRDPYDNELLKVLERRAHLAGYEGDILHLWPSWFPRRMHGEKSPKYLILRTRFLPRDVISFFRAIQDLGVREPFEPGHILSAEKSYSDWFFTEIADALQGMIDESVRQSLSSLLRELGVEFAVSDLHNALERRGLAAKESGASLAEAMYQTHWLGNIWHTSDGRPFFGFKYRGRHGGFSPEKRCVLHLGLRKSLNFELPNGSYETPEMRR